MHVLPQFLELTIYYTNFPFSWKLGKSIFYYIIPLFQAVLSLFSLAVQTVLKSLDDPQTAGLILEEQANALKSILGDASVLKLVRVS